MPHGRFLLIAVLGVVLLGLVLSRGVEPTLTSLIGTAPSMEAVLRCTPLLARGRESAPAVAAERSKPGIAAFVEVEGGGLFRVLVGRDADGEAWSAAVGGGE